MKDFNIYTKKSKQPISVKIGWSWPAFFFNFIWLITKRLWLLFLMSGALMILVQTVVSDNMGGNGEDYFFVLIVGFVICLILASNGNQIFQDKLIRKGYKFTAKVIAKNKTLAAIQYKESIRENGGENNPKSTKSKNDSKVSSAYDSSSDQDKILNWITRYPGLKARQIASELHIDKSDVNIILYGPLQNEVSHDSDYRWSLISTITDEEISSKEHSKSQEKAQEKSKNIVQGESSEGFINELRDLKLLLDNGTINKYEFEKLKKKIINKA